MRTESNTEDYIGCIATWGLIGLSIATIALFVTANEDQYVDNWKWICTILMFFVIVICWIILKNKIENKKEKEIAELNKKIKNNNDFINALTSSNKELVELNKQNKEEIDRLNNDNHGLRAIINSNRTQISILQAAKLQLSPQSRVAETHSPSIWLVNL